MMGFAGSIIRLADVAARHPQHEGVEERADEENPRRLAPAQAQALDAQQRMPAHDADKTVQSGQADGGRHPCRRDGRHGL